MVDTARVWNKNTKVILVVIGVLRSIPHLLKNHLKNIDIIPNITTLQKSALLGAAHILQHLLSV